MSIVSSMDEFGDDDEYRFHPSHLESTDYQLRRWAIMEISRLRLQEYEQQIVDVVETVENKKSQKEHLRRHAVRALGSLQSRKAIPVLVKIIESESGLIVGDAIQSLGKIGARDHVSLIESLVSSPNEWVSQQARHALKPLRARKPGDAQWRIGDSQ